MFTFQTQQLMCPDKYSKEFKDVTADRYPIITQNTSKDWTDMTEVEMDSYNLGLLICRTLKKF